jgi:hypothetical protein
VHRLIHTSVEKRGLHIAESCGTLAHASRGSFSDSLTERLMHTRYFYSASQRAAVSPGGGAKVLYNRLQPLIGFTTRNHFKDHC